MENLMQSNKQGKIKFWLPTLLAIVMVVGIVIGTKLKPAPKMVAFNPSDFPAITSLEQGRVEELIRYIEAKYVDEVNGDELVGTVIDKLLNELDPHSNYISANELEEVSEQLDGSFDGIGIEFMIMEDTVVVIAPIVGGPSEAVGIMAGDKIVSIEDSIVAGTKFSLDDVMEKLRGERGSAIRLGIKRKSDEDIKEFSVKRDEIPIYSVDASYMLDSETGYIKINRFSANTYAEFMQSVEKLVEESGMENLVIDVRQNPGGYLQQATKILSQLFKEKDRLLVYTEGRFGLRNEYESTGKTFFKINNITVLIDEGSASASEILAGAVQDWDRGHIIGRRSFGKGLVQEQYRLTDGSALRLTVARYYTPSGRSIQKSYDNMDSYDGDLMNRTYSGELSHLDSIDVVDSTEYYTASGRVVYGGGGITPDVFVPIDTLLLNDYYLSLRQHIPQFTYRYFERNEKQLDMERKAFLHNFQFSSKELKSFWDYAVEKGIERNENEFKRIEEVLALSLKARLAKILFQEEGYYMVWNQQDPIVQKAIELIREDSSLSLEE